MWLNCHLPSIFRPLAQQLKKNPMKVSSKKTMEKTMRQMTKKLMQTMSLKRKKITRRSREL